ncbi:ROK family protein [Lentzea guizhouensis]|uniref:ROK family protein n=1 Tax=Lentzea guizhouensis TaxID=1586287 RepID=UPI000AF6C7EB|nr:ROK family protein [Lentzea guizhouensis]
MALIGVDVGGTATKAVLTTDGGAVLKMRTVPSPPPGPDAALAVVESVRALVRELGGDRAGVVVPGIVDERRGVGVFSENLGWRDVPFARLLGDALDVPVAFGHDVRAGALAESRLGAGTAARSMVFLPIGTGVSAAAVVDGALLDLGGWQARSGTSTSASTWRARAAPRVPGGGRVGGIGATRRTGHPSRAPRSRHWCGGRTARHGGVGGRERWRPCWRGPGLSSRRTSWWSAEGSRRPGRCSWNRWRNAGIRWCRRGWARWRGAVVRR